MKAQTEQGQAIRDYYITLEESVADVRGQSWLRQGGVRRGCWPNNYWALWQRQNQAHHRTRAQHADAEREMESLRKQRAAHEKRKLAGARGAGNLRRNARMDRTDKGPRRAREARL
jgi:nitrogen-specific signal transduction histidine kinase